MRRNQKVSHTRCVLEYSMNKRSPKKNRDEMESCASGKLRLRCSKTDVRIEEQETVSNINTTVKYSSQLNIMRELYLILILDISLRKYIYDLIVLSNTPCKHVMKIQVHRKHITKL